MALIEGLGDEVVQFFLAVSLFLVAIVAWLSTRIPDAAPVRAVVYVERSESRPAEIQPQIVLNNTPVVIDSEEAAKTDDDTSSETTEVSVDQNDADMDMTQTSSVDTNDDLNLIRNRRLAFFNGVGKNGTSNPDTTPGCTSTSSSTVSNDSVTAQAEVAPEESPSTEQHTETTPSPNIKIRLKYLNDDLKLVDGSLLEQVGDFKKRHFSLELAGRKLVRLIFNGQVLGQESWTLGHYGLHDNCVVHCLIHQPRTTPPPSPHATRRSPPVPPGPLSLFNMLFATLTVILALAWYGRYQYAQFYTATTTVALVGLTGIFTVSLIGIYMPDPPPVNAN